jgi:hypothetical protein
MKLPAVRFGDVYSEGTATVSNIPIPAVAGVTFKGGYKAKHPASLADLAAFAVDMEAWLEVSHVEEGFQFGELELFLGIKEGRCTSKSALLEPGFAHLGTRRLLISSTLDEPKFDDETLSKFAAFSLCTGAPLYQGDDSPEDGVHSEELRG